FWRTARADRRGLSRLFQESAAGDWDADFGSARSICLFAGVGRALSRAGRDDGTHETSRVRRGLVDSLHDGRGRVVSGREGALTAEFAERKSQASRFVTATERADSSLQSE